MTAGIPLLAVSLTLLWAFHCSADTLEGKLLDVPRRYPDGSIRFHVLPEGSVSIMNGLVDAQATVRVARSTNCSSAS